MKITCTDHTVDPEQKVAIAAAICYDSDTSEEANNRRIKKLMDVKHLATLRFAYATFHVEGISRVCSHQLVRLAHGGILQRSMRYVKETKLEVITPPDVVALLEDNPELHYEIERLHINSWGVYTGLIKAGIKKQDARFYLPLGTVTELNMCLNFQGWKDFLHNRVDTAAQWEIREVALAIQEQLRELAPNVFGESNVSKVSWPGEL